MKKQITYSPKASLRLMSFLLLLMMLISFGIKFNWAHIPKVYKSYYIDTYDSYGNESQTCFSYQCEHSSATKSVINPLGNNLNYLIFESAFWSILLFCFFFSSYQHFSYHNRHTVDMDRIYIYYIIYLLIVAAYFYRKSRFAFEADNTIILWKPKRTEFIGEAFQSMIFIISYSAFIFIFLEINENKNNSRFDSILRNISIVCVPIAILDLVIVLLSSFYLQLIILLESPDLNSIPYLHNIHFFEIQTLAKEYFDECIKRSKKYAEILNYLGKGAASIFGVLAFIKYRRYHNKNLVFYVILGSFFLFLGAIIVAGIDTINDIDSPPPPYLAKVFYFKCGVILENLFLIVGLNHRSRILFESQVAEKNRAKDIANKAQLEPHFVTNAFILAKDAVKGNAIAQNHLVSMSDHVREILIKSKKETITIAESIKFCSQYINIIKDIRKIDINFDLTEVDEYLSSTYKIPSFTLLTIVENAVKYAFKGRPIGNKIKISLKESDSGRVECLIVDNGVGIDDETLIKIRSAQFDTKKKNGKGLNLIIKRLSYYRIAFIIQSKKGNGTEIKLIF